MPDLEFSNPSFGPSDANIAPQDSIAYPEDANIAEDAPKLSKNAQKRIAKAQKIAEMKPERRARERALQKEKKRARAEDPEWVAKMEDERAKRQKLKAERKPPFNARIVVDLGFDDLMLDKERKSLSSQLAHTYSANRNAVQPFASLLFTSLNGKTKEHMDGPVQGAHRHWKHCTFWDGSYEKLWESVSPHSSPSTSNIPIDSSTYPLENPGFTNKNPTPSSSQSPSQSCAKETVVYLSADSPDEIEELKEGETYIIGGIVDRNRYKNLCFDKAQKQGIRTARLPIGKYLAEMPTRKVLTVNQVYSILIHWLEHRDWERAFRDVIPMRKMSEGKRKGKDKNKNKIQSALEGAAGDEAKDDVVDGDSGVAEDFDSEDSDADLIL